MIKLSYTEAKIIGAILIILFSVALFTGPSDEELKKQQREQIFVENQAAEEKLQGNIMLNEAAIEALLTRNAELAEILSNIEQSKALDAKINAEYQQKLAVIDDVNAKLAKLANLAESEQKALSRLAELRSSISILSDEEEDSVTAQKFIHSSTGSTTRYILWDKEQIVYIRTSGDNEGAYIFVNFSDLDEGYKQGLLNSRKTNKYLGIFVSEGTPTRYKIYTKVDLDTGISWQYKGNTNAQWQPFSKLSETERNAYESLIASKQ